ncbi:MAG: hypothetical protein MZV64_33335 [Ignavibacteriales bacterium]|nr:hypothetical protein [Ignavibacteriales bacterium]
MKPFLRKLHRQQTGNITERLNNKTLAQIYSQIDKMEKTRVEVTSYRNAKELFYSWLIGGLALLFLEVGLSRTLLRRLPSIN